MARTRSAPRAARRLAVAAAACLAAFGVPAAETEVEVRRDGAQLVIAARAWVHAEAEGAWRVVTDYARYPEFVPGIERTRIVRRTGSQVTVEQEGHAFLGPLKFAVSSLYEIAESPPTTLNSSAQIAGHGTLTSQYTLRAEGARLRIEYHGRLLSGTDAPGSFEKAVIRHTVGRQFHALADEIERQAATARAGPRGPAERTP